MFLGGSRAFWETKISVTVSGDKKKAEKSDPLQSNRKLMAFDFQTQLTL